MLTLAGPVLDHDRLTKPIANAGSKLAHLCSGRLAITGPIAQFR
jgi:hypothetical protein